MSMEEQEVKKQGCFSCEGLGQCPIITKEDIIRALAGRTAFCQAMIELSHCPRHDTLDEKLKEVLECDSMTLNKGTTDGNIALRLKCNALDKTVLLWKKDEMELLQSLLSPESIFERLGMEHLDPFDPENTPKQAGTPEQDSTYS